MSEGWYCPACAAHHAPDVKTCPMALYDKVAREPVVVRDWPKRIDPAIAPARLADEIGYINPTPTDPRRDWCNK